MKIGVIGGGQLAQMLALAGYPLGLKVICLEPNPNCPASLVTTVIQGDYPDQKKLEELAAQVDVITYEFENVTLAALEHISKQVPIYPPLAALKISQDRLQEKNFFDRLGIPTTHYGAVDSFDDLQKAIERIELPAILKTRRLGYDGKGQYVLRTKQDVEVAWQHLKDQSLLLENLVAFEREVSMIAVRNQAGEIVFYPLIENEHRQGILATSIAPWSELKIEQQAQKFVASILTELNYVGVLAVEFFQHENQLYANEMAPRVHNSGHWTIEGAMISQFENHLRAIAGLPLGSTQAVGKSAMLNLIGDVPNLAEILQIPETHCHLYGKSPRPGRKLGHVTLCMNDEKLFSKRFQQLKDLILP